MHGEQCSGISAYAHKARMAKHKLPQKSGYQIQADRKMILMPMSTKMPE